MDKRVPMSLTQALRNKERRKKLKKGLIAASLAVMASVSWNLRYVGITKANLYCGIEQDHIHAADCYEEILICEDNIALLNAQPDLDENENTTNHEHDDDCTVSRLKCAIPQDHMHTLECSSNMEDVETEKDWTAAFAGTKAKEDLLEELVRIARSQAGYRENRNNYKIYTDYGYETARGYSRFGQWYEEYLKEKAVQECKDNDLEVPDTIEVGEFRYNHWDTLFVSFCLYYSGLADLGIPVEATASELYEALQKLEKEIQSSSKKEEKSKRILIPADDETYEAKSGDLVFFDTNQDGVEDSTGIVTEVISEKDDQNQEYKVLKVMEGDYSIYDLEENAEDGVSENEYRYENLTENGFIAFASLPTDLEKEEGKETGSELQKEENSNAEKESDQKESTVSEEGTSKSTTALLPVTDVASLADLNKKSDVSFALVNKNGKAMSSTMTTYKPGKTWYHNSTKHDTIHGFSLVNANPSDLSAAVWKFEKMSNGKYRIYTETNFNNFITIKVYLVAELAGLIDFANDKDCVFNLRTVNEFQLPANENTDIKSQFTLNVRKNSEGVAEISASMDYYWITAYLGDVDGQSPAKGISGMTGFQSFQPFENPYTFRLYSVQTPTAGSTPSLPSTPSTPNEPSGNPDDETSTDPNAPKNPENTVVNFFNYRVNNKYQSTYEASIKSTAANQSWNEDVQYMTEFNNTGINTGKNFKFGKTKEQGKEVLWYNDYVGQDKDARYDGDGLNGSVVDRLLDSKYNVPTIKQDIMGYKSDGKGNDPLLRYLFGLDKITSRSREEADKVYFDNKSNISSVQREKYAAYAIPDTQYLLNYTKGGYWFYDSAVEYAELDQTTGEFTKYPPAVAYDDGDGTGQFFPFNTYEYAKDKKCTEATLDHYFGMSLSTTFMQRYKGYNNADREKPITFEFSGDDDVWIFIDGVLVSDISGIHQRVGVEIDFSTGKVVHTYGPNLSYKRNATDTLKSMFIAAGKYNEDDWDGDTFKNNTQHELKMYYLERGGSASNLKIKFNLIPAHPNYLYKTDQYGNPVEGAEFQVLDSSLNAINGYTSVTDKDGQFIFTDPESGLSLTMQDMKKKFGEVFYLKETQTPAGYRKIQVPIKLEFKDNILVSSEPFKTGVWAQTTASVTPTTTLYKAGSTDPPVYDKNSEQSGTLFAMVLARNGAGYGAFDVWSPVIGNETIGFEVFKPENGSSSNMAKVIEAYQKAAKDDAAVQTYGKLSFDDIKNNSQLVLENLPGSITDYYTYREQHIPKEFNRVDYVQESEYYVAYYYTTAEKLSEMTEQNTCRVESHEKTVGDVKINPFDVQWGAKIEVPNVVNLLIFQKSDYKGFKVAQSTGFALYHAEESGEDIVYTTSEGKKVILDPDTDGDNKGTVKMYDGDNKQGSSWKYTVLDDYSLDKHSVDCTHGGWIRGDAGVIVISDGMKEVGRILPAKNGDTALYSDGTPLVGATHEECYAVKSGGVGHFSHMINGTYVLREVKAPEGFKINPAVTKVVVNDEGVFAHAGTEDDGITVYKGPGYLAHPMHRFASADGLDGTLAWITTALQVDNSSSFNAVSSLLNSQEYSQNPGTATHIDPVGTGSVDVVPSGQKLTAADVIAAKNLLRNYLTYQSDHETSGGLFDYDYNKMSQYLPQGDRAGLDSIVLGVTSGWSNLSIFQDEEFWKKYKAGTNSSMSYTSILNEEYMQSLMDLSHLFSKSTFVEIADKVTAQITVVKTDEKDQPLDNAEFVLYQIHYGDDDSETKLYWSDKTQGFTEYSSSSATVFKSSTKGKKEAYFILPTLDEGYYYLEETFAPDGFLQIKDPISVAISSHRYSRNGSPVLETPMIVKPVVMISEEEAIYLDENTTGQNAVYYDQGGATFQFLGRIANSRSGVDLEITKTDQDRNLLTGAYFVLYKTGDDGQRSYFSKKESYDQEALGTQMLYEWKSDIKESDLMDENFSPDNPAVQSLLFEGGTFRIKGLPAGTYYLREIRPPQGFNPLAKDIKISVLVSSKGELSVEVDTSTGFADESGEKGEITKDPTSMVVALYKFNVKNTSYRLPETGDGYGDRYFIVIGTMLAGGAAGYKLLIRRRKTEF